MYIAAPLITPMSTELIDSTQTSSTNSWKAKRNIYFDNNERMGTIAKDDGGHGGEDGTDGGILDVALLLGLDGLCELGGSHR